MNDTILISNNNVKKIKLPIYHPSPVIVYLGYAQYLSIILSNNNNFNWYISNFIHYYVHLKEKEHIFDFYFPNVVEWQNSLPLRVYKLQDKLIGINRINIIEDIIQWINNGYYIRLEINEKNITGTQITVDLIHPIFIYGYDLENRTFLSINFDEEYTYDLMNISFAEIEEAFYSKTTSSLISNTYYTNVTEDANEYLIILYKLRNSHYSFDIKKFVIDIELYMNGTNVSTLYPCLRKPADECSFWGINIYKGINEYLKSHKGKIDYRIFHGLWEHKKIMTTRLNYLEEKGFLKSEAKISKKFSAIKTMSDNLRILILKYHFTRKRDLIDRSISLTDEIYLSEKSVLEILFNEFQVGIK